MSSLNQMLETLRHFEDNIVNMTPEEIKVLLGDVKGKVDNTYDIITRMQSEEVRLKEAAKELTDRARNMKNSVARLKDYCIFAMKSDGTSELQGKNFDMKLSQRTTPTVKDLNITPDMYLELNEIQDGLVRREYSFDKKAMKDLAKTKPELLDEYIFSKASDSLSFRAHKELK